MNHDLFKSRKFWTMAVGLIMMVVVNYVPELEENANQLTETVLIIIMMVVGGFALEDTAVAFKSGKRSEKYTPKPKV